MRIPHEHPDGPKRAESYIRLQTILIDKFAQSGLICQHDTQFEWLGDNILHWEGSLYCVGEIVVEAEKWFERVPGTNRDEIRLFSYRYNAHVQGFNEILRYDNAHKHDGHNTDHHKHTFHWETGDELSLTETSGCPWLHVVLQEVNDWYWEHIDVLPDPDCCADPETGRE